MIVLFDEYYRLEAEIEEDNAGTAVLLDLPLRKLELIHEALHIVFVDERREFD